MDGLVIAILAAINLVFYFLATTTNIFDGAEDIVKVSCLIVTICLYILLFICIFIP